MFKGYLHPLTTAYRIEIAINDISQHRGALVQGDICNRIGDWSGDASDAVTINGAQTFGLSPLRFITKTKGTERAWIVVILTAIIAKLHHQLALSRRFKKWLIAKVKFGIGNFSVLIGGCHRIILFP